MMLGMIQYDVAEFTDWPIFRLSSEVFLMALRESLESFNASFQISSSGQFFVEN